MKYVFLVVVAILSLSCSKTTRTANENAKVVENWKVAVVDVASLIEKAEEYDGKEVKVSGTVTHVCKHSGKRLHLLGNDEKTQLRIEAGEIGQFERELEGSDIIATGVFRRELIDEEYLAKWADEMDKGGESHSHEEMEEEKGRMERYRNMMKESEEGHLENFWVDGISFETTSEEASI
jgi:hypothetical protein